MFALMEEKGSTVKTTPLMYLKRLEGTFPPLPSLMDTWKRDLDFIAKDIIPKNKEAIIIGDFNAKTGMAPSI